MLNISQLLVRTQKLILDHHQSTDPVKIIIGFSGGPDSMFLLHVLKKLSDTMPLQLVAAHLNHGWRDDATHDEELCTQICTENNIPLVLGHAREYQHLVNKKTGSKESLGRALRRQFFERIKTEQHADFIVLGHHADDQQETFFIRLLRGSSLSGLVSMRAHDKGYLRPLLSITKTEILNYLDENNIKYCTDSTNESDEFLRNRLRKQVIPALKACDNRFDQKFASTLTHLKEEEATLTQITREAFERVFESQDQGSLPLFCNLQPTLKHRVLLQLLCSAQVPFTPSAGFFNEIMQFLASKNGGKHQLHQSWYVWKKQDKFGITKQSNV